MCQKPNPDVHLCKTKVYLESKIYQYTVWISLWQMYVVLNTWCPRQRNVSTNQYGYMMVDMQKRNLPRTFSKYKEYRVE